MSDIVNEEFADLLEDYEDLLEIEKRKDEPTYPWELIKRELDKKYAL